MANKKIKKKICRLFSKLIKKDKKLRDSFLKKLDPKIWNKGF